MCPPTMRFIKMQDNKQQANTIMSDQTKTADAIKLQAFFRGCMCRDRVAKMVQQWIDDLIAQRTGKEESKEYSENEGSFSSLGLIEIVQSNKKKDIAECPTQGSVSSLLSKFEVKRETTDRTSNKSSHSSNTNTQGPVSMNGSLSMNGSTSMNGSVSSILSMFESKKDMKSPVPTRNWTPPKAQKEKVVANQTPLPLTDTPAPSTPKKNFKEPRFVSNATKHVPSSDELLHEQEVNIFGEPCNETT